MLLAIDIGNSNIVCGIFENEKLIKNEVRCDTEKNQTERYYTDFLIRHISTPGITDIVISSVVPEVDKIFAEISKTQFHTSPLFVSTTLKTNVTNLSGIDTQLGADRLCDIVAAIEQVPGNRIVVDLGTATKFEVISEQNEYLGGAIAPGVGDSYRSLLSHASKLPTLKLGSPQKVVGGFNTKEHLDSGYVFGFASLVDGMIRKIQNEQKWEDATVFLTGGFADLISPHVSCEMTVDKTLTLTGMQLLWDINKSEKDA